MKIIIAVVMLMIPMTSTAGTAYWTSHFQQLESDKFKPNVTSWLCEYSINNRKYIRILENYCELTVEIPWEN